MNRNLVFLFLAVVVTPTLGGQTRPKEAERLQFGRPAGQLKVFHLENSNAAELLILLKQLFDDNGLSMASDARSNTLIARGPEGELVVLESLVQRLDRVISKPKPSTANEPDLETLTETLTRRQRQLLELRKRYGSTHPKIREAEAEIRAELQSRSAASDELGISRRVLEDGDASWVGEQQKELATLVELRAAYELAEQQAAQRADAHRKAALTGHVDRLKSLRDQLVSKVTEAFELRQQWQTLELAQSERTLAAVRGRLERREVIRDKIIEHRIDALLSRPDAVSNPESTR